jgi:flagellar motor protein MotB
MKIRLIERDGQLQETLKAVEALTNGAVDLDTVTLLQQQAEQATTLREEVEGLRDELARTYRLLAQKQANPLQVYNAALAEVRVKLLTDLRDQIDAAFPELGVRLSGGRDALQFQGEGLFASGRASLSRDSRAKIEQIADMIDAALPCYTLGARAAYSPECNASFAVVEALQIEGHTDSDGSAPLNVQLSSLRAAATYEAMVVHEPRLSDHQNLLDQPVLSVAGYGEDRPVTENETTLGKKREPAD